MTWKRERVEYKLVSSYHRTPCVARNFKSREKRKPNSNVGNPSFRFRFENPKWALGQAVHDPRFEPWIRPSPISVFLVFVFVLLIFNVSSSFFQKQRPFLVFFYSWKKKNFLFLFFLEHFLFLQFFFWTWIR